MMKLVDDLKAAQAQDAARRAHEEMNRQIGAGRMRDRQRNLEIAQELRRAAAGPGTLAVTLNADDALFVADMLERAINGPLADTEDRK